MAQPPGPQINLEVLGVIVGADTKKLHNLLARLPADLKPGRRGVETRMGWDLAVGTAALAIVGPALKPKTRAALLMKVKAVLACHAERPWIVIDPNQQTIAIEGEPDPLRINVNVVHLEGAMRQKLRELDEWLSQHPRSEADMGPAKDGGASPASIPDASVEDTEGVTRHE